ncbi:hypothetical protein Tco_1280933, partial [Tanacetum coccineum]
MRVTMTHGNIVSTAAVVMTNHWLIFLNWLAEIVILTTSTSIGYGSTLTLRDTSNRFMIGTMGDASTLKPTLMAFVPAIRDRLEGQATSRAIHLASFVSVPLYFVHCRNDGTGHLKSGKLHFQAAITKITMSSAIIAQYKALFFHMVYFVVYGHLQELLHSHGRYMVGQVKLLFLGIGKESEDKNLLQQLSDGAGE